RRSLTAPWRRRSIPLEGAAANIRRLSKEEHAMNRLMSLLMGLGSTAAGIMFLSVATASAQPAPQYPQDDKLANDPAPLTAPAQGGKRGRCGRCGEDDKRGMLNYLAADMVVQAAGLVRQGKVYALGEELHADVPGGIAPARIGIQIIQHLDGYDRV